MNPFAGNKLLRFPERLAEWMRTGRTTGPIVVDFDLTNKCPHNCPACPGEWRSNPDAHWQAEEAIDVLRQFKEIGTLAVSLAGGGDPLAHPQALEIIEAAHDMGLAVGVITNAAIMRAGWPERLCAACEWCRVSLDASNPDTFARVHGVPASQFQRILDNIRAIAQVPDRDMMLGVGFLTNADMQDEIVPAAELVRSLGADYIQYRPFNYDRFDARPHIAKAKQLNDNANFRVFASYPKYDLMGDSDWQKPYDKCHWHNFGTVVNALGEMHFCCDMRCPAGYIGSVKERPVADLWADGMRQKVADSIDLSKCPPFCRANTHNLILSDIANPIAHEVFL